MQRDLLHGLYVRPLMTRENFQPLKGFIQTGEIIDHPVEKFAARLMDDTLCPCHVFCVEYVLKRDIQTNFFFQAEIPVNYGDFFIPFFNNGNVIVFGQ